VDFAGVLTGVFEVGVAVPLPPFAGTFFCSSLGETTGSCVLTVSSSTVIGGLLGDAFAGGAFPFWGVVAGF